MEKKAAVLTGDIIKSSDLLPVQRKKLQSVLEDCFHMAARLITPFQVEQFRGDSFQAVFETRPEEALRVLLITEAFLYIHGFGVRIALGLGNIFYDSGSIVTSDGTAFQRSGPALDDLKKRGQLLAVGGASEAFNLEWSVHALTLGYLLERWTVLQAEAVLGQLQGFTQKETASHLRVQQPAVQQRLQAVGWPVMEAILERFVTSVHADLF